MATHHNISLVIPKSTLSRLPLYYSHIRKMQQQGEKYVSAAAVAQSLNLNPVLVRKDLSGVSSVEGKPRTGFEIDTLLNDLSEFLGYNKVDEAILVGVGSLGRLILTNTEFSSMGLDIAVGFDKDPDLVGLQIGSKYILPMDALVSKSASSPCPPTKPKACATKWWNAASLPSGTLPSPYSTCQKASS